MPNAWDRWPESKRQHGSADGHFSFSQIRTESSCKFSSASVGSFPISLYLYLTIYNPRDFKYRVRHPLVSTSWRLREYTDFDEWHLKSNLMTWCWNWYDFYVDSPLLYDVAMSWKPVNLAHFAELNIQRYCHHAIWQKISMSYKLSGKTKFSMASCYIYVECSLKYQCLQNIQA